MRSSKIFITEKKNCSQFHISLTLSILTYITDHLTCFEINTNHQAANHSTKQLASSESVRRGVAVQFPVHGGRPKRRRSTDRSADLVVAEHRRIIQIRGLRNPEMSFFAKTARKTTSSSSFHFIFEFSIPDLIEKHINIDEVCGQLCEIFEVKF